VIVGAIVEDPELPLLLELPLAESLQLRTSVSNGLHFKGGRSRSEQLGTFVPEQTSGDVPHVHSVSILQQVAVVVVTGVVLPPG
jgi:hypothetical protein